ncbi:YbaL family putative K(+) efflux transporter [Lacisediminimonas sp.]|uniref:YbaL family putative K(+) efflux transporter n=1 Tax=Lacisediminimonas sp. TaxID=3060582 RepID=UPI0027288DDF|nr:YbaL family putative K(+) efflux transporter [Lacisediminimonas sp.]MDO8300633.1 YbaL family putative K(+) efflux transporter [Lacisediminimonas sp.]
MHDDLPLISTIAAALGFGLLFGMLAIRLKLPALVGYLAAGILIGPYTPGFVADMKLSAQLAELGVMLLMFGVGLHFSVDDLLKVRKIAIPGALLQIAVATGLGAGLAHLWGWGIGAGLVFGLALSVASTVVLLRALEDRGILDSINGQIAVGWLVVEDLVTVMVLVLMPPLAAYFGGGDTQGTAGLWKTIAITLGQMAAFVVFMLVVGRKLFPWLLWRVAKTGSRELFTLCVIAAAVGIAFGSSKVFGVSFALGAFFAGMVLRESSLSHRAAQESLPLRDAFSVLFFVSVGMLFEPRVLLESPWHVLAVVAVIVIGKSLAAFALVLLLRYPVSTALTVSASLAQIGEFSFIVAGLGVSLKLLPIEGNSYILAGAIISIAINPLVFKIVEPVNAWLGAKSELARKLERTDDPLAELPLTTDQAKLTGQVVLVGYGRVGRLISQELDRVGAHFVVVEQNRERVEKLRKRGIPAVAGDAADAAVLIQAHIANARVLAVATPDTFGVRAMIETAQALNPDIAIVVRSHNASEAALLRQQKTAKVFVGEQELADSMSRYVVDHLAQREKQAPH